MAEVLSSYTYETDTLLLVEEQSEKERFLLSENGYLF